MRAVNCVAGGAGGAVEGAGRWRGRRGGGGGGAERPAAEVRKVGILEARPLSVEVVE